LAKLKWYPVYGNTIDISKVIPKSSAVKYNIVLKDSKDTLTNVDNMTVVTINGRPEVKTIITKTTLAYDLASQTIKNTTSAKVAVSLGLDSTYSIVLDASTGVTAIGDVAVWKFPSGATAVAKSVASQEDERFASANFKFKIPAQPKAPKITATAVKAGSPKVVVDYRLGLTDKVEVLIGKYNVLSTLDTAWIKASELVKGTLPKDLLASNLAGVAGVTPSATFATGKFYSGKSDKTGVDAVLVPVRTSAIGKKPASAVSYLAVPVASVVTSAASIAKSLTFTSTSGGTIVGALAAGKYIITVSDKEIAAASVKYGTAIPSSAKVLDTSEFAVPTKYAIEARSGQFVNIYKLNDDGTAYAGFVSHKLLASEAPKVSWTVTQPVQ
jgi:hypothetical protein